MGQKCQTGRIWKHNKPAKNQKILPVSLIIHNLCTMVASGTRFSFCEVRPVEWLSPRWRQRWWLLALSILMPSVVHRHSSQLYCAFRSVILLRQHTYRNMLWNPELLFSLVPPKATHRKHSIFPYLENSDFVNNPDLMYRISDLWEFVPLSGAIVVKTATSSLCHKLLLCNHYL